jgi:hypothetical protein
MWNLDTVGDQRNRLRESETTKIIDLQRCGRMEALNPLEGMFLKQVPDRSLLERLVVPRPRGE